MYIVATKPGHLFVCFLCYCKYMRVHVSHILPTVGMNYVRFIDGQTLVRIDGNEDDSLKPQGEKFSNTFLRHLKQTICEVDSH